MMRGPFTRAAAVLRAAVNHSAGPLPLEEVDRNAELREAADLLEEQVYRRPLTNLPDWFAAAGLLCFFVVLWALRALLEVG